MKNPNAKAWFGLVTVGFLIGAILFFFAGTLDYWQAWVYLVLFFSISSSLTLYLIKNDPALLERRLKAGARAEKEKVQKIIMMLASLWFLSIYILPALDHRFAWSTVPVYIVIAGDVLVLIGFYIVFLVYKENTYAAATIEVVANQKVISSGPYAFVRHPMYAGSLIWILGTPLALGSYWGLIAVLIILPILIWRLYEEEKFLIKNLPGYQNYQKKVCWRLIPKVF